MKKRRQVYTLRVINFIIEAFFHNFINHNKKSSTLDYIFINNLAIKKMAAWLNS